jgi:galactokinase
MEEIETLVRAETRENVKKRFGDNFGNTSGIIIKTTPASLILLGDHTHYNEGLLLSIASNRFSSIALRKRDDKLIHVVNNSLSLPIEISNSNKIDENLTGILQIKNVLNILKNYREIPNGWDCAIENDIPKCIGLGASASLQVGIVAGLNDLFELNLTQMEIIQIAREADLEFIGKISNKANHYTSLLSKKNELSFLDLRGEKLSTYKFDEEQYKLVICDTGIHIPNPADICNERIKECDIGIKGLRLYIWGIKNLRDVGLKFLERHLHMIPKLIYNRCLYNVKERIRVEEVQKKLSIDGMEVLGQKMFESHNDLSNIYNISSKEADFLVDSASGIDGVLGSKMISCSPIKSTFNLVEANRVEQFSERIKDSFRKKFGIELATHTLESAKGVLK